jgi:hypothetical protein
LRTVHSLYENDPMDTIVPRLGLLLDYSLT